MNNNVVEIDLRKLVLACLKKWWIIFIAAAVFGTGTYFASKATLTPTYTSTVKLYINNNLNIGNISISAADLSASIKLVDVYDVILKTRDTLNEVVKEAGFEDKYSPESVRSMITTSSINDTQVIQITVTNSSAEDTYILASTIADILPDVFTEIIEGSVAKVVETPIKPSYRSGPSYSKNAVVGALLGAALAAVIIIIFELIDTTIKNEEDLLDIVDVPVLTYVPDFDTSGRKNRYGKYYYKKSYYKSYYKS